MSAESDQVAIDKTFPWFILWKDQGDELPCSGTSHARTFEEACTLAEDRVLHGSFDSDATIYKGSIKGQASVLRTYFWHDRSVVFRDRKR